AQPCGEQNITVWSGTLQSPNYPSPYSKNMDCYWLIRVAEGNNIEIEFQDLSAEKNANCPNDYIEILDGSYGSTVVISRLCGFSLQDVDDKTFVSSSNMLLVHMHTDNDKENRGFLAKHKGICDVRLTALSGTIMSPNHPDNYPTRLACVWLIDVGYGYHTTLTFHKFMLEKNEGCSFDWLSVKEGNSTSSPEKARVCGDVLPPIIEASGPVTITFNTDGDKEFKGFDITYQAKGKTKTKLDVEKLQSSDRYLIWCSR
ncbi:unnamed protein product, partial [Porites evermanni]